MRGRGLVAAVFLACLQVSSAARSDSESSDDLQSPNLTPPRRWPQSGTGRVLQRSNTIDAHMGQRMAQVWDQSQRLPARSHSAFELEGRWASTNERGSPRVSQVPSYPSHVAASSVPVYVQESGKAGHALDIHDVIHTMGLSHHATEMPHQGSVPLNPMWRSGGKKRPDDKRAWPVVLAHPLDRKDVLAGNIGAYELARQGVQPETGYEFRPPIPPKASMSPYLRKSEDSTLGEHVKVAQVPSLTVAEAGHSHTYDTLKAGMRNLEHTAADVAKSRDPSQRASFDVIKDSGLITRDPNPHLKDTDHLGHPLRWNHIQAMHYGAYLRKFDEAVGGNPQQMHSNPHDKKSITSRFSQTLGLTRGGSGRRGSDMTIMAAQLASPRNPASLGALLHEEAFGSGKPSSHDHAGPFAPSTSRAKPKRDKGQAGTSSSFFGPEEENLGGHEPYTPRPPKPPPQAKMDIWGSSPWTPRARQGEHSSFEAGGAPESFTEPPQLQAPGTSSKRPPRPRLNQAPSHVINRTLRDLHSGPDSPSSPQRDPLDALSDSDGSSHGLLHRPPVVGGRGAASPHLRGPTSQAHVDQALPPPASLTQQPPTPSLMRSKSFSASKGLFGKLSFGGKSRGAN